MGQGTRATGPNTLAVGLSTTAGPGNNAFAANQGTTASGQASAALGLNSVASGTYSLATGQGSTASGQSAFAHGPSANASGTNAVALGLSAAATAQGAVALGTQPVASGTDAVALGYYATASGAQSVAIGRSANTNNQQGSMALADGSGTGISNTTTNQLATYFTNGYVLKAASNGFQLLTNGNGVESTGSVFRPSNDGVQNLGTSGNRWNIVYAANGIIQTSDQRLKKDITPLGYGLATVLQLRPVSYFWKTGEARRKIGFVAQELQQAVPEVVTVGTDAQHTLGVNYAELTSILVKAIQEQQQQIDALRAANGTLENAVQSLRAEMQTLKPTAQK